ncbi:MAG: hypothetical protein HPY44_14310 [Armatimonadetes bacterium]|nr:hypothetical protein [Armatimonadota bacterium]
MIASIRRYRLTHWTVLTLFLGTVVTVWQGHTAVGQDDPLSPIGIELVAAREWLGGSTGAVRVVVNDYREQEPVRGADVEIALADAEGTSRRLYAGKTNALGTLNATFDVPDLEPGDYTLKVSARARGMQDSTEQTIRLKRSCQILLNTDKPIYQPGQVIHLRALALRRPGLSAAAGRDMTLEVSDAKGNKVFKKTEKTNDFGICSADFQLADQVNMGAFSIRAILGEDEATKTVTVKKYVLPKFKVTVSTDRQYYLPGDTVTGKVQADYFFGKPVSGGRVALSVKTFDVEFTEVGRVEGKTDENGTFEFETRLPTHFVGQPLEHGQAFLELDVQVTDQAEHAEKVIHTSTVAAGHLNINAVPEAGTIVAGVDNIVYVLTSRPTGEPVEGTIRVLSARCGDKTIPLNQTDYGTDALGIAEITLAVPADLIPEMPKAPAGMMQRWGMDEPDAPPAMPVVIEVAGRLADGTLAKRTIELPTRPGGAENLLLRVDRPLASVGDPLNATALCGAATGTVYFDLVKDRQTMLTYAGEIRDGRAQVSMRLSPELSGTCYVSAYRISGDGQIIRDTRPVFVQPAGDLQIGVEPDRDSYVPGQEAKLAFSVVDENGRPVAAALGINVVDESVFALQELQPGMEKVFFYLEQELMTPRYEIHGFEMPTLITKEPVDELQAAPQQAARVLFAGADVPTPEMILESTFNRRLVKARESWAEGMRPKLEKLAEALGKLGDRKLKEPANAGPELVKLGLVKADELLDLWKNPVKVEIITEGGWQKAAVVISAGPDGKFDTLDDLFLSTAQPGQWFKNRDAAVEGSKMWRLRGGFGGDIVFAAPAAGMPGMAMALDGGIAKGGVAEAVPTSDAGGVEKPVRVREYFPETLYFEPSLITDENGKATLTFPMADSITTWRLAAIANSALGKLGSTTKGLRCFQDFFVDIDLPVALTQNDQVSIPIAVYNYLPETQTVRLQLAEGDWFELDGEATQSLEIAANEVNVRYFTLTVKKIGHHPLTVHAYGSKMSDAIKRSIEVLPDGKEFEATEGGRLSGTVEEVIEIPEGAIADASSLMVKVYPGVFSQAVEGLDSILQMPFGCFEQTSSVTWPNIMVLDYMKATRQSTPEIQMKAEGFINTGYQRMLSYEVPGGGFSWFGNAPANRLLTAYGLMEFHDMSAVHTVDPDIIRRTQNWLLDQAKDGVYEAEEGYCHAETWAKVQVDKLLPTAYIVWGLTHSQCKDPRVNTSADYVRENWKQAKDPYTLAIVANALVGADSIRGNGELTGTTLEVLKTLVGMAKTDGDQMWWESSIGGVTNSTGRSADLEATGMAALALLRGGHHSMEASRVLNYLVANKDPRGTWFSTNATIFALRALVMAQKEATTRDTNAEITITVNGERAAAFAITPEDADVMRAIDCRQFVKPGANKVRIDFAGQGSSLYQVVGRYYMPWKAAEKPKTEALSIDVQYDKTRLAKDDTVTAKVTVSNNTPAKLGMVVVDLGIPPGFTVDAGDFAELVGSKKIDRFNLTGRQVIVYLETVEGRQKLDFSYTLQARYPLKAQAPKSTVYEYYNPENRSDAKPVGIEVTEG